METFVNPFPFTPKSFGNANFKGLEMQTRLRESVTLETRSPLCLLRIARIRSTLTSFRRRHRRPSIHQQKQKRRTRVAFRANNAPGRVSARRLANNVNAHRAPRLLFVLRPVPCAGPSSSLDLAIDCQVRHFRPPSAISRPLLPLLVTQSAHFRLEFNQLVLFEIGIFRFYLVN